MNDGVHLRLYITGRTGRSEAAVANLQRICDQVLPDGCDIEIVDVLDRPELAEEERVLVTPTLDKLLPLPVRRIIGDLSDDEAVIRGLGLTPGLARQDARAGRDA